MNEDERHQQEWGSRGRLNRTQAMRTYCAKCGAMPDEPCTYVATANHVKTQHPRAPRVLAEMARVGQPTGKPHNERSLNSYNRMRIWLRANCELFGIAKPHELTCKGSISCAICHPEYAYLFPQASVSSQ